MNLINKQVSHTQFGKGSVTDLSDSRIEINFKSGTKRFVFPDAFGTFLSIKDKRAFEFVRDLKEKKEEKKLREEAILKKESARLHAEHQRRLEREHILNNLKIHPSSQAVFWCEEEEQNRVFSDWTVFTGTIKSGISKGEARKLSRLNQNSACLLTARDSDMDEKDRRIIGIYMVKEGFVCKLCEDGYIPAHPEYRIQLTEAESKKLLFWDYYVNEAYPHRITWNSGTSRYLSNIWTAQILKDIVSLKKKTKEGKMAQEFLDDFCEINQIHQNGLPKPKGALKTT